MIEALNGKAGELKSYLDYGYFGVLRAEFDENGSSVGEYTKKPSYYAYQNFIALFGQGAQKQDLPIILKVRNTPKKCLDIAKSYSVW
jgi:hypothetical protein